MHSPIQQIALTCLVVAAGCSLVALAACGGATESGEGPGALVDAEQHDGSSGRAGLGGADSGFDAGCGAALKQCDGSCVGLYDPAFGCALVDCAPCALPHATATCNYGACGVASCDEGHADCNGNPADGCEIDIFTDLNNCGACDNVCEAPACSGGMQCSGGVCGTTGCSEGHSDCDCDAANGCEVDLLLDSNNCGGCGSACTVSHGMPYCGAGVCQIASCHSGWADCDYVYSNGCETDLTTDPNNCGACASACQFSGVGCTPTCIAGACSLPGCSPGTADCDGIAANCCEVSLLTDPKNCGGCGTVCVVVHGTAACDSGICKIAYCDAGWGDCDKLYSNGCETDLATDPGNCGGCAKQCSGLPGSCPPVCVGGVCGFPGCNPGTADCDCIAANGCEVSLLTDPKNCGGCGTACVVVHGTAACNSGICKIAYCDAGWADCDKLYTTACETSLANDSSHCGSCSITCASGQTCVSGTCT